MSQQHWEDVFGSALAEKLWTANTELVLPLSMYDFSVGGVLPAVLYMLRRGFRRGKGCFRETFLPGGSARSKPTLSHVAADLAQRFEFAGFDGDVGRDVLADLLLAHSFENKNRKEGHDVAIMRVYPTHYFASWIDLPKGVANLRFVPEFLVALLADQPEGDFVEARDDGPFPIGRKPESNALLRPFSRGTCFSDNPELLDGDRFDESVPMSPDELVTLRAGRACRSAPEKARPQGEEGPRIRNRKPLSRRAARFFREDLASFVEFFGEAMPRRALTSRIEALIGLGLWHNYLASLRCAVEWEKTGRVPEERDQVPPPVFVDASSGADFALRDWSERSTEGLLALLDEATVALACIRVIAVHGRSSPGLAKYLPKETDPAALLDLLGRVRRREIPEGLLMLELAGQRAYQLGASLTADRSNPAAEAALARHWRDDPIRGLGEALVEMMGERLLRAQYIKFLDSAGMTSEPHGLVRKRKVSRTLPEGRKRRTEARSVVLSDELLEALVHAHLARRTFPLSFGDFLRLLRSHYGLWVDQSPPGLSVPGELLLRNRATLERRLRDLGLLVGVNDAESMKHLRLRYTPVNASER